MTITNLLHLKSRDEFRSWLMSNHKTERECWIQVKRGKIPPDDMLWYLDAVEEALCFGWIDSTVKQCDGVTLQRFGPRAKSSRWTELNKERCRRLEKMGLMTDSGLKACPDLNSEFVISPDIIEVFKNEPSAWDKFKALPQLYQRVRIDNIQRVATNSALFQARLKKLIEATLRDEMIGDWHDCGRLIDY